ncbi:tripartite tricarboxylate transporter permease [Oricola indica]|jgi:putative tricarboxylic transport membrane protein|uniref:tripartite tricarboxylate transporter permease n=1 Tax=Oricola indica TaxID=2872591 RepID=UPI003CCBE4B5
MYAQFLEGLALFAQWQNLLYILAGVFVGTLVGAIPGLSGALTVAILIPFTFYLSPVAAIVFLVGIYKGAVFGASISAILINVPGTASSTATLLDGYPMTKRGEANRALSLAHTASVFGDTFSDIVMILVMAPLAAIAVKFGPPEMFAVTLFALTVIATVSTGNMVKGLMSGAMGMLLAVIGPDVILGTPRFWFDTFQLQGGISFIPMLIGLFGISEVLDQGVRKIGPKIAKTAAGSNYHISYPSMAMFKKHFRTLLRSSIIGTIVGIVPGVGQSLAAFLAYSEAKHKSDTPEIFGTGCEEGIVAPEAANNAVNGASFVPLLTLGIPGDVISSIIAGAFLLHGMVPGPTLFQHSGPTVYAILIGMLVANGIMFLLGHYLIRLFAMVVLVPTRFLFPIILTLCVVGAFSINNNIFDIYVMVGAGLLGLFMKRTGFPLAPLIIAFLVGPMVENAMRQSLLLSGGDWTIFFTRPIALGFFALTLLVTVRLHRRILKTRRIDSEGAAGKTAQASVDE